MVSTMKQVTIAGAIALLVIFLFAYVIRYRKDRALLKGILFGFLLFMATNLLLTISEAVFPNLGIQKNGITGGIFMATALTAASLLILPAVSKKVEYSSYLGQHMGYGFVLLTVITNILVLANLFMFSFALNEGPGSEMLQTLDAKVIESWTEALSTNGPAYFLSVGLSAIFVYLVYSFALSMITLYVYGKRPIKDVLVAFVSVLALFVIPNLLLIAIPSSIVLMLSQFAVAAASLYYLYKVNLELKA